MPQGVVVRAHERQILAPDGDIRRTHELAVLHAGALDCAVVQHDRGDLRVLRPDRAQAQQDPAKRGLERLRCLLRVLPLGGRQQPFA